MIDFNNADYMKLRQVKNDDFESVMPLMVAGESVVAAYRGIRDGVIFTNKRVIAVNIQGITGKKKDMTSMPYSKVQVYSIETAGTFDMDSELELWFSGVGKVRFEFTAGSNIVALCRHISEAIL